MRPKELLGVPFILSEEIFSLFLDSLDGFREKGNFHLCPFCQENTMIKIHEIHPFYRCPIGHPELKLFFPGTIELRKKHEGLGFFCFCYYSTKEEFLELMEKERSGDFKYQSNAHYICLDKI